MWWQQIKSDYRHQEVSLVTEVRSTHRWALDYRPNHISVDAHYVVNARDTGMPGIAPDFAWHHSSASGNTLESPDNNPYYYTILAKHCRVSRKYPIDFPNDWLISLKRQDLNLKAG